MEKFVAHKPVCQIALLTPAGRSAIAVIGLFGEVGLAIVDRCFDPVNQQGWTLACQTHASSGLGSCEQLRSQPISPVESFSNQVFYGGWRSTGEDVIVVLWPTRIEIHCHGGEAPIAAITQDLIAAGCVNAPPSSVASHLYSGWWRSEVSQALASASTEKTAEILLRQFNQANDRLGELQELLVQHSMEFEKKLRQMLAAAPFGLKLAATWSIVLCGRPNVGKSSLINALVGYDRSIVHDTAGTTRDVVTQLTAVEGWPIELKDTAGLRRTEHPIEQKGIELSEAQIQAADLRVIVIDARDDLGDPDLITFIESIKPGLIVRNKIDLLPELSPSVQTNRQIFEVPILDTSTVTKRNIDRLVGEIANLLVPQLPPSDLLIPVTESQVVGLRKLIELSAAGQVKPIAAELALWRGTPSL